MPYTSYRELQIQIAKARARHGTGKNRKSPVPFPDLSVEQRTSPTSDALHHKFSSQRISGAYHKDAQIFPVANNHKQGYELVTPGTIKAGHMKHMNGSKQ